MVIGILAHVDAGKTTLSEAILYSTGKIRSLGRVDHQDAYLDNDVQERERGITIFSKQARFTYGGREITILDTPGHVDFSAEMERTLSCLDYAVLVVSGSEGVQGHTRTLWRLLRHYNVPAFLFINKMDLPGADRDQVQAELKSELSDNCVDMTDLFAAGGDTDSVYENLAVISEEALDEFMETGVISPEKITEAIRDRCLFPCFYGSALKLEGVEEFLQGLAAYGATPEYPSEFGARVYKIGRDSRGVRMTYMKITGGALKVREKLEYMGQIKGKAMEDSSDGDGADGEIAAKTAEVPYYVEKVDQIRKYSGEKFDPVDAAEAGDIVAVIGLSSTFPGQGLGSESDIVTPVLEPVLNYQLILPKGVSPLVFMEKMRQLEEEDPKLKVIWKPQFNEIHVRLMGAVQMEVLQRLIAERYGVAVSFGPGSIVYQETIARPVEGVGHFEPLRHYAEVHLLMEPADPGSGITVTSSCSEDILDRNWQRLIATHVEEKIHKGVLTGSALTDVKFTIVTGRAHIKHTEGGDFRQATYRAIRQGLKSTESILLEPYYNFILEVPMEHVGRALTDLEVRFGKVGAPEFSTKGTREMAIVKGRAPVSTMQDYISEVHAYTQGLGALTLELQGYDVCHNPEEVIEKYHYDSELDFRNPTGSVFCAHGSGFPVPWDEVPSYMHLEYVYSPEKLREGITGEAGFNHQAKSFGALEAENLSGAVRNATWSKSVSRMSSAELDKELADVYAREFGMSKADMEEAERKKWAQKKTIVPEGLSGKPRTVKYDKHGNPIYPKAETKKDMLIVDGYNVIFSWPELNSMSRQNIDSARDMLVDILSDYQGFARCRLAVVFDAYKVKGNSGKQMFYDGISRKMTSLKEAREKAAKATEPGKKVEMPQGIEIIYTKTDEIADARIERMVHDERDRYRISVVTNDGLEQLTILSMGALRMTAKDLEREIERVKKQGMEQFKENLK